jgi:uncharacterized membrane protein YjgN (DUF898 family)
MATLGSAAAGPVPRIPVVAVRSGSLGAIRFLGREADYWRLLIRGSVFLLLTLGLYRFWLATDQRRFLWANTEIAGDALEYTGTARELLIGFLIAVAVLVPLNVVLFAAALYFGLVGASASGIIFVAMTVLGQFAIYRARRYRLTRTVYRGVRFHQTGSAWVYALYAVLWWALTLATLGLAYPWAQASLERYKMRHTFYGDLGGRFAGSGTQLFLRGITLWLIVLGPAAIGLITLVSSIDWSAVADAVRRGGGDLIGRVDGAAPNLVEALTFLIFSLGWGTLAGAMLYPAFQAMMLRWWASGIRFGDLVAESRLRTGQMYRIYLRFLIYSILFGLAAAVVIGVLLGVLTAPGPSALLGGEIPGVVLGLAGYVMIMLGYSTIYQVIVKLRYWQIGFESVALSGLHVLDKVRARGEPGSPFGEGLADALDVGGL